MNSSDKATRDLHRLLSEQNFQSQEEIETFMQSMVGHIIPTFEYEQLSDAEKAEEMIYEMYGSGLSVPEVRRNVEKALQLDPDCIAAYELLASLEMAPKKSMNLYKTGADIGRRIFGGEYLKENKGRFWLMIETRPFMRCLFEYSRCLYMLGEKKKTIEILEELLELNPDDSQGTRDYLMLYLIELEEYIKYKKYAKEYKRDRSAFAFFNEVLFSFKTRGNTEVTRKKLQKAADYNPFVVKRLLSKRTPSHQDDYYEPRKDSEAVYYACEARLIWHKTPKILEWLKEQLINK